VNRLQDELAPRIVPVVLANVTTPYPYHDSRLVRKADEPFDPIAAHPAFGNSFDWHSSVHAHWTAVHLLEHFADKAGGAPPQVDRLRAAVASNLAVQNITAEAAFLGAQPSYERPYGWAWALALAAVASTTRVETVHAMRAALHYLGSRIASRAERWLAMLPSPVRHGVHSNTAFAMGLMLDASRTLTFVDLEAAIAARAREWFGLDRGYPAAWERSAHDFLSPGLAEADLLRRVMPREEFGAWWSAFLARGGDDEESILFAAASVPNVSDGQVVHLHGLNLSRAAMLARIAHRLRGAIWLADHARALYRASVDEAYGAEYLSTHWLPTFAWDAARSIDALGAGSN